MSDDRSLAADLAAWGKVIVIETKGRSSGRSRVVSVGFVDDGGDPATYLVAASDEATHWARNLLHTPVCFVTADAIRRPYLATPLEGEESQAVATELILKYGTPSERLGGGRAFRLDPISPQTTAP
jgi:hypothetical protein